jgi:hypothetical protein
VFWVLAVQFSSHEQTIIGVGILLVTLISVLGLLCYKGFHLFDDTWPKIETSVPRVVKFYYDTRIEIAIRRAELAEVRLQLRSKSRRDRLADASAADSAAPEYARVNHHG